MREKTLAEGLVEGVIAVILSRWSRRSDLIRPMYSHSPCCRASRIDTARSAIQYRDSENKTQSEIFEGQGARLLIFRLSEVSRTPLTYATWLVSSFVGECVAKWSSMLKKLEI